MRSATATGDDPTPNDQAETVEQIALGLQEHLGARRPKANEYIEATAVGMKARYGKRRKTAIKCKVGDLVLWRDQVNCFEYQP